MQIFFAGTPAFAVPSLQIIAEEYNICGVLTAPDKKSGRGNKIISSPVKNKALELNLPVFQPVKLDQNFYDKIYAIKPDILVVAAYGKIFKKEFLDLFKLGGINIHPSILPKYRGPSPIPAVILSGESETGVTIQQLALKMDSGPILAQKKVNLNGDETTLSLSIKLSNLGADMIIRVLDAYKNNTAKVNPQDHEQASYCSIIKKEDGNISWENNADIIERKIRAYYPWPKAYTLFRNKYLFLHQGSIWPDCGIKEKYEPGYVIDIDKIHGILVQTGNGILGIKKLQLQAKKETDFLAFVNGHRDILKYRLGD